MRAILTLSSGERLDVGIPNRYLAKPGKPIFLERAEDIFRQEFGRMITDGSTIVKVHLIRTDL